MQRSFRPLLGRSMLRARVALQSVGIAAALVLFPMVAGAQEIPGGQCAAGGSVSGQFDAGWFHNAPTRTRRQDGYWPNAPAGAPIYWDNPRDTSPLGADTSVVANYAQDETVGPGLVSSDEGGNFTRYNYAGVGGAGSTFAQAVSGNDYLQYQFTTPASLDIRTFFKRTGFGTWNSESYEYAVRVSTSPTFATYWTIIQDERVTGGGGSSYNFRAADTTRFPLLRPSTTYYIRVYLYDRTVNLGPIAANTISADDFQIGTGTCPLPALTVSKVSNGGTGSFSFSGNNGFATQAITTATAGTAVAAPTQILAATNTATTITEAAPAGFALASINCTGLPSGTPTYTVNGINGGNVQLPAAAMTSTANISCTFTNQPAVDLSITKTNTPGVNGNLDQASDTVTSGASTVYTLRVNNAGPANVSNAVVRDVASSPGLANCQVVANSCTTTGTATCPAASALSYANLTSANGVVVPLLNANASVQFQVSCTVQ